MTHYRIFIRMFYATLIKTVINVARFKRDELPASETQFVKHMQSRPGPFHAVLRATLAACAAMYFKLSASVLACKLRVGDTCRFNQNDMRWACKLYGK